MAHYRAISVVSDAVVQLLRASYDPDEFNNELEFKVFTSRDFANPISNGISLFVYRIYPHGVHRSLPGRIGPDGRRLRPALPVELHFLLTVWGKEAALQHAVAGWMMRTLEDFPILPSGALNAVAPEAFRPDETVEVGLAELRTEDLLRIWEVLGLNVYQLSVPYLARVIHIESTLPELSEEGPPVQLRQQRAGVIGPAEAEP